MVVAIGRDAEGRNVIGHGNGLLWHIPDDLKRFKRLTLGHPIIMGRKTFESIVAVLGKPLPGRTNIVITRDPSWSYEGVEVFHSLGEALSYARTLDTEEIHVGGGAQLYEEALPITDRLYLTVIDDEKEGDTYFPDYTQEFTKVLAHEAREWNGLKYEWLDLERA